ncbi:hypothetical protein DIPPA_04286 [Diplonema papillatum]|nr:hypothetical protein DIPPA_04286 [Diplonema papillatum]
MEPDTIVVIGSGPCCCAVLYVLWLALRSGGQGLHVVHIDDSAGEEEARDQPAADEWFASHRHWGGGGPGVDFDRAAYKAADRIRGQVDAIDSAARVVFLRGGRAVRYTQAIVCTDAGPPACPADTGLAPCGCGTARAGGCGDVRNVYARPVSAAMLATLKTAAAAVSRRCDAVRRQTCDGGSSPDQGSEADQSSAYTPLSRNSELLSFEGDEPDPAASPAEAKTPHWLRPSPKDTFLDTGTHTISLTIPSLQSSATPTDQGATSFTDAPDDRLPRENAAVVVNCWIPDAGAAQGDDAVDRLLKGAHPMVQGLAVYPGLTDVRLTAEVLRGDAVHAERVARLLAGSAAISRVDVSGCGLPADVTVAFLKPLLPVDCILPALSELDASGNDVPGEALSLISSRCLEYRTLRVLKLSRCSITSPALRSLLPPSRPALRTQPLRNSLEYLDLSRNNLAMPDPESGLPSLDVLDRFLFPPGAAATSVRHLDLSFNGIEHAAPEEEDLLSGYPSEVNGACPRWPELLGYVRTAPGRLFAKALLMPRGDGNPQDLQDTNGNSALPCSLADFPGDADRVGAEVPHGKSLRSFSIAGNPVSAAFACDVSFVLRQTFMRFSTQKSVPLELAALAGVHRTVALEVFDADGAAFDAPSVALLLDSFFFVPSLRVLRLATARPLAPPACLRLAAFLQRNLFVKKLSVHVGGAQPAPWDMLAAAVTDRVAAVWSARRRQPPPPAQPAGGPAPPPCGGGRKSAPRDDVGDALRRELVADPGRKRPSMYARGSFADAPKQQQQQQQPPQRGGSAAADAPGDEATFESFLAGYCAWVRGGGAAFLDGLPVAALLFADLRFGPPGAADGAPPPKMLQAALLQEGDLHEPRRSQAISAALLRGVRGARADTGDQNGEDGFEAEAAAFDAASGSLVSPYDALAWVLERWHRGMACSDAPARFTRSPASPTPFCRRAAAPCETPVVLRVFTPHPDLAAWHLSEDPRYSTPHATEPGVRVGPGWCPACRIEIVDSRAGGPQSGDAGKPVLHARRCGQLRCPCAECRQSAVGPALRSLEPSEAAICGGPEHGLPFVEHNGVAFPHDVLVTCEDRIAGLPTSAGSVAVCGAHAPYRVDTAHQVVDRGSNVVAGLFAAGPCAVVDARPRLQLSPDAQPLAPPKLSGAHKRTATGFLTRVAQGLVVAGSVLQRTQFYTALSAEQRATIALPTSHVRLQHLLHSIVASDALREQRRPVDVEEYLVNNSIPHLIESLLKLPVNTSNASADLSLVWAAKIEELQSSGLFSRLSHEMHV